MVGGAAVLFARKVKTSRIQVVSELGALLLEGGARLIHSLRHREISLGGAGVQLRLERGELRIARGDHLAQLLFLVGSVLLHDHALTLGGGANRRLALVDGRLELGLEFGNLRIRLGLHAHELGGALSLLARQLCGARRVRLLQGRGALRTRLLQLGFTAGLGLLQLCRTACERLLQLGLLSCHRAVELRLGLSTSELERLLVLATQRGGALLHLA